MSRHIWINKNNAEGQPLNPRILKVAEELADRLVAYRFAEIGCFSTANDLLQSAVESVSRTAERIDVRNPGGYLTSTYRRLVDRFLNADHRLISVDATLLDELANTQTRVSFEDAVHTMLAVEQSLALMDKKTEEIFRLRLDGYSDKEIAERLGSTANAISVRCNREIKRIRALLNKKSSAPGGI